ncbi:MAG: hypothetical protein KR126chlam3_01266 [Chlamydiae bacterium]|nr:hypothetical protein [Chlamydiota bacterium]
MKIFIRFLLSFFILTFGVILLLQTPLAKYQIKKMVISAAKEHGIDLSIQKLDGNLPFEWKLKNVSMQWEDQIVFFDTIKARCGVFPLFKKQLEITHFKMLHGKYKGTSFDGTAKGRIDLDGNKPIKISQFLLEGDDLFVRMEGKIEPDLTILEGSLTFHLPDASLISPLFSKGTMTGFGSIASNTVHFDCSGENIFAFNIPLQSTNLSLDGVRKGNGWEGTTRFSGGPKDIPIEGEVQYRFSPSCRLITIDDFQMEGPNLHFFGKMDLDPSLKCLEGTIFAKILDLKVLRPLFPDSYLKGRLGAKIDFQSFSEFQDLKCQIEAEDLGYGDGTCETFSLESTLYDLFGDLRGEFSIEASHLTAPKVKFDRIEISSIFEPGASPFSFFAKGDWEGPLEVAGKGNWQKKNGGILTNVEAFNGFAYQKRIALCESFAIDWTPEHFKMHNLSLDIGNGHLFSRIDLTQSTSLIKIKADEFPLEFIPLPHRHFSLAGIGSIDIDLLSWDKNLQGSCNVALKRALFLSEGSNDTLTTKGSMQVHLSGNTAQIHGELKAKGEQFVHFSGTLPILFDHFPFKIQLDEDKPFSGDLIAEGKLQDLFNFINIGHQRIEGWLTTNLHFSKTLAKPMLQGEFDLQDGFYENYYSGTLLKEISAKGYASKQNVVITDLYAVDGKGGSASAKGNVLLNRLKKFPFTISGELNQFEAVTFDTITGNFSGQVTISGDRTGAIAKGKLKVDEATFRIPDSLPTTLPELPIAFVNPPESITRKKSLAPPGSPLKLDLDLIVPGRAYVEGRGLTAELKGKLHLTGNFIDIVAKGNLQLINGEYIFSGKVFDLTQGEVIFNDQPSPSSYISLSGNCDLSDVSVTVMLQGPISSPNLSFQSSPQLPTSSLLSQILFNKDFSEISAVQALQLAQTVISLSGNSAPDILEKIRKTLGIDRLTLITSENDPGKISLQIGKYLMRGVMLTLSQGRESRNVSVEVDLKKGIRFQAEVNEDQQGKFSLKWHHHY